MNIEQMKTSKHECVSVIEKEIHLDANEHFTCMLNLFFFVTNLDKCIFCSG